LNTSGAENERCVVAYKYGMYTGEKTFKYWGEGNPVLVEGRLEDELAKWILRMSTQ
jgi:hypothetical protein